jgi:ectoine hydroxylase-related dioxygenase (phytanoyl-CoA dioxygenase family)
MTIFCFFESCFNPLFACIKKAHMNTKVLPDLGDTILAKEEKIKEFQTLGHVLIENILSRDEVTAYRDVISKAAAASNTEQRRLLERDTYGRAFLQIMNLWRSNNGVRKFTLARRFARIAADLLGVDNVRIYHDQALFKEPGGGPTPWHQDQYYWPVDTPNTVTMWMPLVDIDEDLGMLTFASGSHKNGVVFDYEISDESEAEFDKYVRDNKYTVSRARSMNAGDATWHYGYTIHNAPGNTSNVMREVMTIIYLADGARITTPKNKWQENDLKSWLMCAPPGSGISSELNPVPH